MGRLVAGRVVGYALVLMLGAVGLSGIWYGTSLPDSQATLRTNEVLPGPDVAAVMADVVGATLKAADPGDAPGSVRIAKPTTLPLNGPRKVALQAGHWLTQEAPPELGRILQQTGTSWNGITEVEVNIDIAERVAALLATKGVQAEVLPTTVPPGYLADAFVSLHADGDGTGEKSGFKSARSARRGLFEDRLQTLVNSEFAKATDLHYDANGISRNMTGYYAMAWSRIRYSTSPFTPSMILEMGYLSNDWDRHLMVDKADVLASAIANGILTFLDENPRSKLFGQDLVLPPAPQRGPLPFSPLR